MKSAIFKFEEGLHTPLRELQQSIVDLLVLLAQNDMRTPVNCLIMQKYFPPSKYERWKLPPEFKLLLREIGVFFDGGKIPTAAELDKSIQKARDLPY